MFLKMNDFLPMTTSTKPSKRDRFFLQMKVVDEIVSTKDITLSIKQGKLDMCTSESVCSQSITTDTSSIASAESTITSVNSEPPQKSALKRRECASKCRSLLQQRVRILFNPAVQQQRHIARHEYTSEELNACWFRGEEYAQITRSCCKAIKRLEQQQQQHQKRRHGVHQRYCSRGLESHTRLAAMAKDQNRRVAWDAVLDEQCDQVSLGVIDDEVIASRYHDASRSCRLWALRVGQQVQRVAELVYDVMLD
jgi:hypothetical protein